MYRKKAIFNWKKINLNHRRILLKRYMKKKSSKYLKTMRLKIPKIRIWKIHYCIGKCRDARSWWITTHSLCIFTLCMRVYWLIDTATDRFASQFTAGKTNNQSESKIEKYGKKNVTQVPQLHIYIYAAGHTSTCTTAPLSCV